MRKLHSSLLSAALIATLGGLSTAAVAQSAGDETPPRNDPPPRQSPPPRARNNESSLSDAVRRAQRETGGQVLGAERIQFDGRDINRVKVMDDSGRVRYMDDDPQRGRATPQPSRSMPRSEQDPQPRPRGDNPRRR
jgi:hypothetical protein